MNTDALDAFTRHAAAILSRLRAMQGVVIGALGAIATGVEAILGKKDKKKKRKQRKRKRRRRRRKQQNNTSPPPEPSCSELCDSSFESCFERVADSTLCADALSTDCSPCRSDQECIDSATPYCLRSITNRESGQLSNLLTVLCGAFTDGVCTALIDF